MDDDQQFCLRWNNHQSTLISVFDTLLENETLVDCTLAAEGKFLKAHKVVLSACSPYFATLLQEQYDKHPIFILKDVKYQELRAMMDYMYRGEVNISQDQLTALLKAAESLQIKGLSDNRSGTGPAAAAAAQQQQQAPKPDTHHRVKLSAPYTLEQTKRARITTAGAVVGVGGMVDAGDVAGSREGSSSPSRRRRKVRRRSMENDMHDNSNSSVLAAASNQSILQQTSAGLAASALVSTQLASGSGAASATVAAAASSGTGSQVINQPLTSSSSSSNVTKKTESAKLTSTAAAQGAQQQQQQQQQQQTTSDAINTDNVQQQNQGAQGEAEEMDVASGGAASGAVAVHPGVVKQLTTLDKSNHKQKIKDNSITTTEMVIEPKAEYDDDAHDENVEDLTLDEEDMTMEELDQAAGTSQGGEGSSQAYATWQHDRSQDELGLMAAQDAQQRDPQGLLELSLNQSSSFYYEPDIPLLLEPAAMLLPPPQSPSPSLLPPPMTTRASGQTLRRGKRERSRKRRNNSAAAAAAAVAAAKKLMKPAIPQPPLLERSSSAATLARNAELRDDGKLQCPQCPNAYTRLSALKRHIEFECGQLENFRCSVCDAGFKRKDSLNRHCKVKKHITKYLY
ncbi:PREDICTED: longitudinals lacking protein, isoforms H/M/V isoform X11 [Drosophila arizonae]|uniref:Longitudinals lacking protein, isoforms H/M/V isoform X11 n=1 Tax=Drosophila arizonae TaxID=7263 RepID=A0ABM1PD40_DROAR|nr:PREDICTED: longitudinals lacking protein, isoforms H/M/V isoform X11 [Drosophila arizonae]